MRSDRTFVAFAAIMAASPAMGHPFDLQTEGKHFRERIGQSFQQKEAANALRIQDLTADCREARFVGRDVEDVNRVLKAAGQQFDLLERPAPGIPPHSLVGGFVLANSFGYSAVFNIILRARDGKVEEVFKCNVMTRSL